MDIYVGRNRSHLCSFWKSLFNKTNLNELFPQFILVGTNSSICIALIPSVETQHLPHSAKSFRSLYMTDMLVALFLNHNITTPYCFFSRDEKRTGRSILGWLKFLWCFNNRTLENINLYSNLCSRPILYKTLCCQEYSNAMWTFFIGTSKNNAIYVLCKTNMWSWYHNKIYVFCNKIWFALTHASCYSVSVMQNIIIINWLINITYKYSNYKFTNKLITTIDKKWEKY
jgi:hypothetical protein